MNNINSFNMNLKIISIILLTLTKLLKVNSQVTIRLYTAANPSSPIIVNEQTQTLTQVNGFHMTDKTTNYIIVHGFNSNGEVQWALKMKDRLLSVNGATANVLIIDWREGAGTGINYQQAVYNMETSVADVYRILNGVKNDLQFGNGLLNVYCIGHSLGSHFCGFTSKFFLSRQGLKFERITGLDPAGPCFEDASENKRLSKNDAKFVDAIHTSSILGYQPAIGHIDFYPNGGSTQPGCFTIIDQIIGGGQGVNKASIALCRREIDFEEIKETLDMDKSVSNVQTTRIDFSNIFLICSHGRAIDYFTESITNNPSECQFTSTACSSYIDFLLDRCTTCSQNTMGLNANPEVDQSQSGKYFLRTYRSPTFCVSRTSSDTSQNSTNPYCLNSALNNQPFLSSALLSMISYLIIFVYFH